MFSIVFDFFLSIPNRTKRSCFHDLIICRVLILKIKSKPYPDSQG